MGLRRPTVFIGSSSEAVNRGIVAKLVVKLSNHFDVRPWNQHFTGGRFTLEVLLAETQRADAAIFIFGSDDHRDFRGETGLVARDNVILEYGLFAGTKGRDRVLIIEEKGVDLPSDVLGITTLQFRSEKGAAQEADFDLITEKIRDQWKDLSPRPAPGDIQDSGLGFAVTLHDEQDKLAQLISSVNAYASEGHPSRQQYLVLDSSAACISTYSEALGHVQHRFWTTTFLSSGFWSQARPRVTDANTRMMKRLQQTGGEARRLFLLDQEPDRVADAYRALRIQFRQLEKQHELRRLESEFAHLKRNIRRLISEGCEVRVVCDTKEVFKSLPAGMLTDPNDSELAIYDSFRVDVFDGGRSGDIVRVKSYCPLVQNFEGYRTSAERYFEDLWEGAEAAESFLDQLQQAVDSARAGIDYESNWLAIYEFALDRDDEDLKTVEIKRVEEVLRKRGKWGKLCRYLDVGTCTGRYLLYLREAVIPEGQIIGIDEDYDCVRFARSNIRRHAPQDRRILIHNLDFGARDVGLEGDFDLITCMLGTLSHFGWNRSPSFEDTLQGALLRMSSLLKEDGLLMLGTWSRYACESRKMINIYREADRRRLAEWTRPLQELRQRLADVGLKVTDQFEPEIRLDFLVCERHN